MIDDYDDPETWREGARDARQHPNGPTTALPVQPCSGRRSVMTSLPKLPRDSAVPGKSFDPKARGRQRAIANVGKSDCERTFARATGNDHVAPKPDL